jgi:ER membrane protein complex subunit 4
MLHRPVYQIDLNVREGHEGYHAISSSNCPPPLGYKGLQGQEHALRALGPGVTRPTLTVAQQAALTGKRQKLAMSIAMKPGQQILMQAFMLWMSGSQLNMFSINVTSMAIITPLAAIFTMDQTFGNLRDVDLKVPKLLYTALNLAFLGVGLYKMSSMRLLPTTAADWTSKIVWKDMMEQTSIPPDNMIL